MSDYLGNDELGGTLGQVVEALGRQDLSGPGQTGINLPQPGFSPSPALTQAFQHPYFEKAWQWSSAYHLLHVEIELGRRLGAAGWISGAIL